VERIVKATRSIAIEYHFTAPFVEARVTKLARELHFWSITRELNLE